MCFILQWADPTEYYTNNYYRNFIRTPVVWDDALEDANPDAEYDDPKDVFPDSYVEYIETLYGEEKRKKSMIKRIGKPESQVHIQVFTT